ncbi:MAG TPA: DUF1259 domain-containing protein [Gemmatimonadales bacterium]|nr:DUF1259 domain-containing protein [Gemmatimonadales bacterium]
MASWKPLVVIALTLVPTGLAAQVDWKQVEQAFGRTGAMLPGDVYRVAFPRADLHVTVNGVVVLPALALGSWVALKQTGDDEAMLMGDLVLLESEIERVIDKLQESGIEQTAVHNHLRHESPHVLYMHIAGGGAPAKLAASVRAALAVTNTPLAPPTAPSAPASTSLDTALIAQTLGYHGRMNGGVYQVAVARAEPVTVGGMDVPPGMGVATAINFQPTAGGKAAVTGDFVLIESEVNPVIRALRSNGIDVTALHSHMLGETPRLFFMHFWGDKDALDLAHGLRAALERMNVKKG